GLEYGADVGRAITEITHGDVAGTRVTLGPRVACAERNTAAHDRMGAEPTRLEPLEMHRTAPSVAVALGKAKDLSESSLQDRLDVGGDQGPWIDNALADVAQCLGKELVVSSMRPVYAVRGAQTHDRADRAALLPNARVRGSVHETLTGKFEDGLLERADEVKLAEHGAEQL